MPRNDPRSDTTSRLRPANAVAALITVDGDYLLQLRDNVRGIYFPGRWGCFGGALDDGETEVMGLVRELREELGIELPSTALRYFTRCTTDYSFTGGTTLFRSFYEIELGMEQFNSLHLNEGAAMRRFNVEAILASIIPMAPLDDFALWLHINRARLAP